MLQVRGIERLIIGRPDAQHAPEVLLQRQPVSVAPLAADDERHEWPASQRAAHLLVRQDAVLDAARIEERREARVIRAPELVVERQERAGNLLADRRRAAS